MVAPCDWTLEPGLCCDDWDSLSEENQLRAITVASRLMWAATGRRYGPCEVTVQPCPAKKLPPLYRTYPEPFGRGWSGGAWDFYPYIVDGQWFNPGTGGCGCCKTGCEIALQGPTRTAGIVSVTVEGVVVPPTAYVVFDAHLLARVDGECWPTCVNYANQDPPDFEVTYLRGLPVPQAVLDAASVLACEFGKACANLPCRLPQRLRRLTRQGVELEVADIDRASARFLTGIEDVDMVIQAENPFAIQSRPRVFTPDRRIPRRVS
jgi:hypothetical protein